MAMHIPNYLHDRRSRQRRDTLRVVPDRVGRRATDEFNLVAARLDAAETLLAQIITQSGESEDRYGFQWYG